MNEFTDWMVAIALIILIVVFILLLATIMGGAALLLVSALVISVGLDILLTPFRWVSSLFKRDK